ncbi:unnamed protein product [Ostreobium quekettii]|uniref:Uncharacterized protein n=1 Tax=Ostreobium quekettii TaxID=121088 RepID=A0A8S1IW61_9CHLO|nr:unnamed protein product [Ostreobium quekettii]
MMFVWRLRLRWDAVTAGNFRNGRGGVAQVHRLRLVLSSDGPEVAVCGRDQYRATNFNSAEVLSLSEDMAGSKERKFDRCLESIRFASFSVFPPRMLAAFLGWKLCCSLCRE